MANVYRASARSCTPCSPGGASDLPPLRRRRDARDGRCRLRRRPCSSSTSPCCSSSTRSCGCRAHLPLNPAHVPSMTPGTLQHRGELRDQHELAGLRPRDGGELPHPDARAGPRELRLGRRRHGGGCRLHSRLHAPLDAASSATSGSTSRAASSTSCCPSARRRAGARLSGRRAEPQRARRRSMTVEGVAQTIAQGPVRLAGDHQGARHQRRRLLQRQLRAPVREPHAAHQPPRDAGDPRHPRGASPTCSAASPVTSGRAGRSSPPRWCSSS